MAKIVSEARKRQIEYLSDPENKAKYLKYQRDYHRNKWHTDPMSRMKREISTLEWIERNKEKVKETDKRWREKNKDKLNAQNREYRKKKYEQDPSLKEKEREKNRLYREQNRTKINARKRERYQNDPAHRLKMQEKARESMAKSRKK